MASDKEMKDHEFETRRQATHGIYTDTEQVSPEEILKGHKEGTKKNVLKGDDNSEVVTTNKDDHKSEEKEDPKLDVKPEVKKPEADKFKFEKFIKEDNSK